MTYTDKSLQCADCGTTFTFTAGEQEFYSAKGLVNEPKRCPSCRQDRKAQRSGYGGYDRSSRQMFTVICAECGVETQVPFEPREGRAVYCSSCYDKNRR